MSAGVAAVESTWEFHLISENDSSQTQHPEGGGGWMEDEEVKGVDLLHHQQSFIEEIGYCLNRF